MKSKVIYRQKLSMLRVEENAEIFQTNFKQIYSSQDAAKIALNFWDKNNIEFIEESYVLLFNKANKPIGWALISQGGTSSAIVDPKVVFSHIVLTGASAFILFHNHPSGNLTPSQADNQLTDRFKECAKFMDVKMLDHIIITGDKEKYYSFTDGYSQRV